MDGLDDYFDYAMDLDEAGRSKLMARLRKEEPLLAERLHTALTEMVTNPDFLCQRQPAPRGDGEPDRLLAWRLRGATSPAGPYSPGVDCGELVFLAGQIGKDPATGALVPGGVVPETRQVMENLGAVLHDAGLGFGDVVKASVFLADVDDFGAMNEVYGAYFPAGGIPPARTTVQVAAIPRGARVEIDFIAVRR